MSEPLEDCLLAPEAHRRSSRAETERTERMEAGLFARLTPMSAVVATLEDNERNSIMKGIIT